MASKKFKKKSILFLLVSILLISLFSVNCLAETCSSDKIALLGDSITNYQGTKSWGNEFRKICEDLPVNFAHSGKRTDWMLQRLKGEVDDSSPYTSGKILGEGYTHLIITGGTNDITAGWDTTITKSNLEQIYSIAKQGGMKVYAGTIPPYNRQSKIDRNNKVKEINEWIKSQHQSGKIDGVIDFYQLLVGAEPCMNSTYGPASCNNVHPNTAGYKAMASKVANEVFTGQTITGQAIGGSTPASANVNEINTLVVLGSGTKTEIIKRVNGAYSLILQGNFQKIILSGGCVPPKSDQDPNKRTCFSCDGGCTEAKFMRELLLSKDPNLNYKITLEDKSQSTSSNYKNFRSDISQNEKVLVVSNHRHVRPVAYCLRYSNPGAEAYYYYIGISNAPEVPSINLVTEKPNDYYVKTIAKKCEVNYPPGQQAAASVPPTPPIQRGQPSAQSSTGQQTSPQQQQTQQQTNQQTTLQLKGLPKIQEEIDEVWFLKLGNAVRDSNLIWDYTLGTHANDWNWREFEDVYYEEVPVYVPSTTPQTYPPQPFPQTTPTTSPTTSPGGTTALSSDLIGPTVWCNGNEGLPQPVYQDRIQKTAWYPGGSDTLYQLAVSVGNSKNVHPALLATHMVYESSMKKGKPGPKCTDDTGRGRSILTGCGWTGGENGCAATPCGCKKKSTESDKTQLECTAAVDQSAYLQALGRKGETNCGSRCYYAKCDEHKNDPDKMWKCILCVYQGDYDRILPESSSTTYFTSDDTCKYAENFKKTYCSWVNYFVQQGASSPVSVPTLQPAFPTVAGRGQSATPFQGTYTGAASVKDPNCLILYGDTRNPTNQQKIALESIKNECTNPSLFHVGDFVGSGERKDQWDQFLDYERDLINKGHLYAIVGNHEDIGTYNGKGHKAIADHLGTAFPYLKNQMAQGGHYTVPITDNLIAIILNTDANCNSETKFLKQQLAANPDKGVMLGYHKPAYANIGGSNSCSKKWHKLLLEHKNKGNKVLAFAGHTHGLARAVKEGVTHLEVGAMLNPRKCTPKDYTKFCKETRGYYRCDANLHCVAKDENGGTLEQFDVLAMSGG